MASEKRLIEELREMADRTPPICHYDKPYNTEIFGKQITVYCKPFEQFQELLRRAADALSVDAVEVVRCGKCLYYSETTGKDSGKPCGYGVCTKPFHITNIVTNEDFCSFGQRGTDAKMDGGKDDVSITD